jgi:hypothetical protein
MRVFQLLLVGLIVSSTAIAGPPISLPESDTESEELGDDILMDLTRGAVRGGEDAAPAEFFEDEEPEEAFDLFEESGFEDAETMAPVGVPSIFTPGPIPLPVDGLTPLQNNYPVKTVHSDGEALVLEIPILVSSDGDDFTGPISVRTEIWIAENLIGSMIQTVTDAMIRDGAPTFLFPKLMIPVPEAMGELTAKVYKVESDIETLLFSRVSPYALR